MTRARILLRQVALFREAARRGITRKMVQFDGGFSESTVRSWADGTHEMPVSAFARLAETGALPLDLLSMLFSDGMELARAGGAAGVDHASLAASAGTFVSTFAASAHPESERAERVGPGEARELDAGAARLRVAAGGDCG